MIKNLQEAANFIFCTSNPEIIQQSFFKKLQQKNFTQTFNSFTNWGLEINPNTESKFGQVVRRNFSFIPLFCYEVPFSKAKELLGKEGSIETLIQNLTEEKLEGLEISLLEEKNNRVFLLLNKSRTNPPASPADLLKEMIDLFGQQFEAGFLRYFVNNCLITDQGEAFGGEKEKETKTREELYNYIKENVVKEEPPLKESKAYIDSFPLRPFFGDGLLKIPTYNKEGMKFEWGEMFMNPGIKIKKEGDDEVETQ